MFNKMSFLLLLATFTAFPMENNQPHPGDEAIKNHPYAWTATKIIGGTAGGAIGISTFALIAAFGDMFNTVVGQGPAKRANLFKVLAIGTPVAYGSWKAGQTLSEAAWYPAWSGIDKAKKLYHLANK